MAVQPFPTPLEAVNPLGSLVYAGQTSAGIDSTGEVESFTIDLDDSQKITLLVDPAATLTPVVEILDPSSAPLASTIATSSGAGALLQSVDLTTGGTYTINVSGDAGTLGSFSLHLLLNAAQEEEEVDGTANDTFGTAQDLDGSFIGVGLGTGQQAAVLGSTFSSSTFSDSQTQTDNVFSPNVLTYDFANVPLPLGDAILTLTAIADLDTTSEYLTVAAEGFFSQTAFVSGGLQQQQVVTQLTIPQVTLEQLAADGTISISVTPSGSVNDLGANELTLELSYATTNSGGPTDWYAFSLDDGQSATIVGETLGPNSVQVELYDQDGTTLLAQGATAARADQVVADFTDTTSDLLPGTYYLRVFGAGDYNLVVARDATLDVSGNVLPEDALPFGTTGTVLTDIGPDGSGLGRLFTFSATGNVISENDPVTGAVLNSFVSPVGTAGGPDFGMATTSTSLLVGGISSSSIYELNPDTGALIRTITNPGMSISGLAFLNNEIFVLQDVSSPRISVLDYATGAVKRSFATTSVAEALGASGDILLGTSGSSLYEIDLQTGVSTLLGVLPSSGIEGLGVVGDELFVSIGSSVVVTDLSTLQLKRTLTGFTNLEAIGADGGGTLVTGRYFEFDANVGDALTITTATPADGPHEPNRTPDPFLEIFDPNGQPLPHTNVAGNETWTHTAAVAGKYLVHVSSEAGAGSLVLELNGNTAAAPPFAVVGSTPSNGSFHTISPSQLTIDLSDAVLLSSVAVDDLLVDGLPTATNVSIAAADTLVFDLPPLSDATHTLSLAAAALSDLQGQPLEPFSVQLTVDADGPRIIASSILQNQVVSPGVLTYTATFDELLDESTLDAGDVELIGSLSGQATPTSFYYDSGSSTVTVQFSVLTEDEYTLRLVSSPTGFHDAAGNLLDGERNVATTVPSGNVLNGGDFVVDFSVDIASGPFPVPFLPLDPSGGLIYTSQVDGRIVPPTDVDEYTVNLDAGQLLTLVVTSDFQPNVTVLAPDSSPLASAAATASGDDVVIQGVPIDVAGTYTFRMESLGGTTGGYTFRAFLNAIVEEEQYEGPLNNDPLDAQDLDAAFVSLPGGAAQRAAVLGATSGASAGLPFEESFPTTTFDPTKWSLVSNATIDEVGIAEPSEPYSLRMNGNPAGGDQIESVTIDLSGQSSATLSYWFEQTGGGETVDSGEDLFLEYMNASGTWVLLDQQLGSGPNMTTYQQREIALPAAALHENFRFRFRNIGTTGTFDDWFVDDIKLVGDSATPGVGDWYRFTLADGQSATAALSSSGGAATIELYDSTGTTLLANGISTANLPQVIQNFVDTTTDGAATTYLLHVLGPNPDYQLVLTRGADFDIEDNDAFDDAQDIGGIDDALGYVDSAGDEDWYQFGANSGDVLTITTGTPGGGPFEFVNPLGEGLVGGLIISEVVDGTLVDGNPKFVEITNTSDAPFTFAEGGLIVQSNNSSDRIVDVDLTGVTIASGESFVIAGTANDGQAVFESTYGFAADLYADEFLGDGNDRFLLTDTADGSHIVDIYGVLDTNGTGQPWEYTDSYAYRLFAAVTPDGSAFDAGGWFIAGPDLLETGDDSTELTLLQTLTTPGTHEFIPGDQPTVRVELYDPLGVPVELVGGSVGHTALLSGNYRVRVFSLFDAGEYVVSIDGATGGNNRPVVVTSDPVDNALLNQFPTHYTVTFSEVVLAGSVDASDLLINGQPHATNVTEVDPFTFTFELSPAANLGDGTYGIELPAGAIVDLQGEPNEAFAATFDLDETGPTVLSTQFNGAALPLGGNLLGGPLTFEAFFSEDLRDELIVGQIGPEDIVLTNSLSGATVAPLSASYDAGLNKFTAVFDTLEEGLYEITLISADGAFEDLAGNDLDGEPWGPGVDGTPSGDGVAGGDCTVSFKIDSVGTQATAPFERLQPLGSLMSASTENFGVLGSPGDVDDFEIYVQAGQLISAVLTPGDPTATVFLSLVGVAGPVFSSSPGEPAVLDPQLIPISGPLTLRVTGNRTTTYSLDIYANSALEQLVGDSADGNELNITGSYLPLGSGRFGAIGEIVAAPAYSTIYNQDFNLSDGGFVFNNATFGGGNGLWHHSTGRQLDGDANHSPTGNLYFGQNESPFSGGDYNVGATAGTATSPAIALPDVEVVALSFHYLLETDGVFGRDIASVAVDAGNGLVTVLSTADGTLPTSTNGNWGAATVDLSDYAGSNITLQFSFNSVNAIQNDFEGWFIDDIEIQAANTFIADWDEYTIDLTSFVGKPLDFVIDAQPGGSLSGAFVELLGPDGTSVVATATTDPLGLTATNFDQAILGYVPTAPGVYTLRIISDEPGRYGVLVTESLAVETEPNDGVGGTPRNITGTQSALGYLGAESGGVGGGATRLFTISSSAREIVELNPATGAEVNRFAVPGAASLGGPDGLAFNGTSLFYTTGASYQGGILYELDPDSGAVVDSDSAALLGLGPSIDGLGAFGGLIFAVDYSQSTVNFIDTASDTLVGTVPIPLGIVGGAAGAGSRGSLFLTVGANSIVEVSPYTGETIQSIQAPFSSIYGLAYVNGALFAGTSGGQIAELDPDTGAVLNSFAGEPVWALGGDDASGTTPSFANFPPLPAGGQSTGQQPYDVLSAGSAGGGAVLTSLDVGLELPFEQDDPLASVVGSELAMLSLRSLGAAAAGATMQTVVGAMDLVQVEDDLVAIEAVASGDTAVLLQDLLILGLQQSSSFGRMISGWLPVSAIADMAALASLQFARPAYRPETSVGLTTSQADAAMYADVARTIFGVDGSGITVGVLSDTYDRGPGSAGSDISSGDLPGIGNPLGHTTPVTVLSDASSGNDEGRAMLQLVHDVAPGAGLAFHTAANGQADFANGILELQSVAGAQVITDDVIYFAEPMFQDGIIAQAIDTVVANGATYFSSAGNNARSSWAGAFEPSGSLLSGRMLHDFDPGPGIDTFQSITVPAGTSLRFVFQWDSPFFSVSGGAGTQNDLDIFILNSTGTTVLASGTTNNLGGDALEVVSYVNTSGSSQLNVAIGLSNGAEPGMMKWIGFGRPTVNEYGANSGTTYGHSNSAGAFAVGAADYRDTPAFGTNPPEIEYFSSAGGLPILFDTAGNSVFDLRAKPNIVAPDGTNTTFFGSDADGDGFPNFFGTSAAAPHAAAVAALMRELAPTATPAEIYAAMVDSAIDMDDPSTPGFDVGFDSGTGPGLLNAVDALTMIQVDPLLLGPRVAAIDPDDVVTNDLGITSIQLTFTEQISDSSATNTANYQLLEAGPNGVFEDGGGDDTVVPLTPGFDGTAAVLLTIRDGATPLGFGKYQLTIDGDNSIEDLDGNPLNSITGVGGGSDTVHRFDVVFEAPPGGDYYRVELVGGDHLTASTRTPFDDPAASPLNDLDTRLVVYGTNGAPVAFDNDSADGRNALLSFVAPVNGTYFIQVAAEAGAGEYILDLEIEPLLPGDYNGDDVVDGADYSAWRDASGQEVPKYTSADGDGNGLINEDDFLVWRSHHGWTRSGLNSGAGAAAVETTTASAAPAAEPIDPQEERSDPATATLPTGPQVVAISSQKDSASASTTSIAAPQLPLEPVGSTTRVDSLTVAAPPARLGSPVDVIADEGAESLPKAPVVSQDSSPGSDSAGLWFQSLGASAAYGVPHRKHDLVEPASDGASFYADLAQQWGLLHTTLRSRTQVDSSLDRFRASDVGDKGHADVVDRIFESFDHDEFAEKPIRPLRSKLASAS